MHKSQATSAAPVRTPTAAAAPSARGIAPFVVVRAVIAAAALAFAIAHMAGGEASLPLWLWKISVRLELPAETMVRLLASVEATLALVIAASTRLARPMATVAVALLAFSAVAELSALLGAGATAVAFVRPLVALAFAGLLATALGRRMTPAPSHPAVPTDRSAAGQAPPAGRPIRTEAPIGVGSLLGATASLLFCLGLMARLPVPDRPKTVPESLRDHGGILFRDLQQLVGKTLPESGLARHQPHLTAMTLEGRHIVVFYNPLCSECRDLFDVFFSGPSHPDVIACEVPPPSGAVIATGDPPFTPDCRDCRRTRLADGPSYFARTPVVMTVQDGRITCIEHLEPQRCLDP